MTEKKTKWREENDEYMLHKRHNVFMYVDCVWGKQDSPQIASQRRKRDTRRCSWERERGRKRGLSFLCNPPPLPERSPMSPPPPPQRIPVYRKCKPSPSRDWFSKRDRHECSSPSLSVLINTPSLHPVHPSQSPALCLDIRPPLSLARSLSLSCLVAIHTHRQR